MYAERFILLASVDDGQDQYFVLATMSPEHARRCLAAREVFAQAKGALEPVVMLRLSDPLAEAVEVSRWSMNDAREIAGAPVETIDRVEEQGWLRVSADEADRMDPEAPAVVHAEVGADGVSWKVIDLIGDTTRELWSEPLPWNQIEALAAKGGHDA